MTQTDSTDQLIDVRELHAALPSVVVLDVRWSLAGPPGRGLYEAGHVPGARFADLDTVFSRPPAADGRGGRHPLPTPEQFEQSISALGVSDGDTVVVYDADGGFGAARAWWTLRYFGHPAVRFLDGGFVAWTEAGFEISEQTPPTTAGRFTARPGGMPVLDAEQAAKLAETGVLLDARAAPRFRGEHEPIDPRAGHIPGAVNAPTDQNSEVGGGFHDPDRLRARFDELGADGSTPVGVYCGSGVSAAHEVLALSLAGVPASLYVGSWSDWVSDPERPVATD